MKRFTALATALLTLASAHTALAAESGVTPEVLSLPKGPGSVQGLGEEFAPSANSGTASYGIGIETPSGSGGFKPAVRLAYDGGRGNSAVGFGWSLPLPRIQRQTDKGLPRYTAADTFIYQDATVSEELVPLSDGSFRLKNESDFLRARMVSDGWEVRTRAGVLYRLGLTQASRVSDASGTRVFAWNASELQDTNGNIITLEWTKDQGQAYLSKIRYNDFGADVVCAITFSYEARTDALADYRAGFAVTTAQRLSRIEVSRGGDLVRAYALAYDTGSSLSRLAGVTKIGSDNATALPPLTFGYARFVPQERPVQEMTSPPGKGLTEHGNALVDLNADSLPDLIVTAPGDHRYYLNEDGVRWSAAANMTASPSYALSQDGVRLADVTGDGISDLVAALGAGGNVFLAGSGDASWLASVPFDLNPVGFDPADADTRFVDLNADRLIDVLRTSASGTYAWIHQGNGTYERLGALPKIETSETVLFSDPQIHLADLNADGLLDVARLRSGSLVYWPSAGYGRFDAALAMDDAPLVADETRLRLADLNADGLSDIVYLGVDRIDSWLNQGDGAFAVQQSITGTPSADPITGKVEFADMNGNGTTDILWVDVSHGPAGSWQYLDPIGDQYAGLLTRIDNGLGKVVTIAYASSTAQMIEAASAGTPWGTTLPFPTTVVRRVTVEDGIGPAMVTEYAYRDGFYDGSEREFRGFAEAAVTQQGDTSIEGLITTTTFDVGKSDETLKGKPLAEEKRSATDLLLTRVENDWQASQLALGTDGRAVSFAALATTVTTIAEGGSAPKYTRIDSLYDAYGNVIESRNHGLVASAADTGATPFGNDEVFTTRAYAVDETAWILDRVSREVVRDAEGTILRDTRSYYDGLPYAGLGPGQVDRGNLMRQEQWLRSEDRFVETARYRRDAWGNITAMLDGVGGRREIDYDFASHTYPVRERIFANSGTLEFSAAYDPLFDAIAAVSDPNGATTSWRYDALGRPASVIRPGDSADLPTAQYLYTLAAPLSSVEVRSRESSGEPSTLDTYTFVDGLGRTRAEAVEDEGNGFAVTRAALFNARGTESFVAEPFRLTSLPLDEFASLLPLLCKEGIGEVDPLCTFSTRDALSRVVATAHPDGTRSRTQYAPLAEILFDENDADAASPHANTPTTRRSDGQGRLVSVAFSDAGRELITTFGYDATGNLTSIADAAGNVRTQGYDGLGRMVWLADPNAGRRDFVYDDAGNLVEKRKPGDEVVRYQYEPTTRRLLAKNIFTGTDDDTWEVRYHYDEGASNGEAGSNLRGRLAQVEDAAGAVSFSYDGRGRQTLKRRTIGAATYAIAAAYDALDRQTSIAYPDGSVVPSSFDERGLLQSVGPYLSSRSYNAAGQVESEVLGSGIVRSYSYDARRRLTEQSATSVAGDPIQAFGYSFDAAGNIQAISDSRPVAPERLQTQSFLYDDLYRLTAAQLAAGTIAWAYDDVGNITQRSNTLGEARLSAAAIRYGEEGAGPYAQTSADDVRFGYDRNGRLTSMPGRALAWDAEDRLTSVTLEGGTTVAMTYGHDGNRVIKRTTPLLCKEGQGEVDPSACDGATETLYISPEYELRSGAPYNYIWADGQRLARAESANTGAIASLSFPPPLPALSNVEGTGGGSTSFPPPSMGGGRGRVVYSLPIALLGLLPFSLPWARRKSGWRRWLLRPVAMLLAVAFACGTWLGGISGCGGGPGSASLDASSGAQPGVVYYLTDHLGSAQLVTDSLGTILHEESRYPYGLDRRTEGTAQTDYVYTGKELDEETGLIYFGGRYYAPEMGRWASPDPKYLDEPKRTLEKTLQLNLYTYTEDNPVIKIDTDGYDVIYLGVNLSGWLAAKPFEPTQQAQGPLVEYGIAIDVKSFDVKRLLSIDNYDVTSYGSKGLVDEHYESTGLSAGIGLNAGYLGRDTTLKDMQGKAIEHVGAVMDYGINETVLENNVHGVSIQGGLGFGLGTTTYETETKTGVGLKDMWTFMRHQTADTDETH